MVGIHGGGGGCSFSLDALGDIRERAGAALLQEEGEEVHLEEHVAELVEELLVVALSGGVGELVGLLDRVRNDRALVLLAVPWAFDPQAPRDLVQPRERADASPLIAA